MKNEIVLVGDVHRNHLKVLNWQIQCIKMREQFPVVILDYPTIMTCGDTVQRMNTVDINKAIEVMNNLVKLYGVKVDTKPNR